MSLHYSNLIHTRHRSLTHASGIAAVNNQRLGMEAPQLLSDIDTRRYPPQPLTRQQSVVAAKSSQSVQHCCIPDHNMRNFGNRQHRVCFVDACGNVSTSWTIENKPDSTHLEIKKFTAMGAVNATSSVCQSW